MACFVKLCQNKNLKVDGDPTCLTGILRACRIRGDEFKFEALPLRNVRPLVIKEVVLKSYDNAYNLHTEEGLMKLFEDLVNELLADLASRSSTDVKPRDEQLQRNPLVRLKVDYSGYSTCNPQKFGQRFINKVYWAFARHFCVLRTWTLVSIGAPHLQQRRGKALQTHLQVANPKDILHFQKAQMKRREQRDALRQHRANGSPLEALYREEEDPAITVVIDLEDRFTHARNQCIRLNAIQSRKQYCLLCSCYRYNTWWPSSSNAAAVEVCV